jgi:hypothetical protein
MQVCVFNLVDCLQDFLREQNVAPDDSKTTQTQSLWHQWQQRMTAGAPSGQASSRAGPGAGPAPPGSPGMGSDDEGAGELGGSGAMYSGVSFSELLGGQVWGQGGLFGDEDMLYSVPAVQAPLASLQAKAEPGLPGAPHPKQVRGRWQ